MVNNRGRSHPQSLIKAALVAIAACAIGASPALSQDAKPAQAAITRNAQIIRLYHGGELEVLDGPGARGGSLPDPLVMKQGGQVCFEVANAHTVLYNYSLDVVIDSSKQEIPSLAEFTKALTAFGAPLGEKTLSYAELLKPVEGSAPARDWVATYYNTLKGLADTLKLAESDVGAGEHPENKKEASDEADGNQAGFRWIQKRLGVASVYASVRDSLLGKRLETLYQASLSIAIEERLAAAKTDAARKAIKAPTDDDVATLDGLHAFGKSLVEARDALFKPYEAASAKWKDCKTVGKYPFTISLSVKRKTAGKGRKEGDKLSPVTIVPRYDWKLLEVAPALFYSHTAGTTSFTVEDGIIRRNRDEWRWRAGTLLVLNGLPIGEEANTNLGVVLGLGWLDNKDTKPVDITLGGVMSFRDKIRLGLGIGSASRPDRLKAPAVEGAALPAGTKSLDDLVVNAPRFGVFFFLSVTGWSIKTPF